MPFPTAAAAAAADPTDPTSQIAWPGRKLSGASTVYADQEQLPADECRRREPSKYGGHANALSESDTSVRCANRLTKWNLFAVSLGMAGAQVAWTVELGYGTPFLLSLGLSEQLTSLVWLAGPISGLITQPVIGAVSDSSSSRYRRRFWIVWSTVVLVVSCLALAYAEDVASVLADFFRGGVGDWDPKRLKEAKNLAMAIAIIAFYLLDFSLNALQASLRNLLLDVVPPEQLNAGNAWHGRMTHAGNIIGFGCGFLNLAEWPLLRALGGSQFRKFCVVGIVILTVTVWVTCWTQDEVQHKSHSKEQSGTREVLGNVYNAVLNLPKPIRQVCLVQVFAFVAWFPFLFYATTYVGQVMARQDDKEPDVDVATRAGNFAMLIYSLVAVIAGSLLPQLTKRDERLLGTDEEDDEEAEAARIQRVVTKWKAQAGVKGKSLKLPRMPLMLRDMWRFSLVLYGVISLCTFFINTVVQATVAIALIGISWAVAVWAPFAIIMEFLKEVDESVKEGKGLSPRATAGDTFLPRRAASSSTVRDDVSERTALLGRPAPENDVPNPNDLTQTQPVAGGTVLGIHNLAIVFPQFIIALVASVIFKIVDEATVVVGEPKNIYLGKNGVAWVLRFGGLSAFLGAVFTQMVPPTLQERRMARQLAKMKAARNALQDSSTPYARDCFRSVSV